MQRRREYLVQKRDGRTEFLRTTKLARSIHLALLSVGVDEDWRALELANAVLTGLRCKDTVSGPGATSAATEAPSTPCARAMLSTADLADAVQQVLVVTGMPAAAASYGAIGADRARRRRSLAVLGRGVAGADLQGLDGPVLDGPVSGLSPVRRRPEV
jgi:hypothetical protein